MSTKNAIYIIAAVTVLLFAAFCAGCSSDSTTEKSISTHGFEKTASSLERHYTTDGSCYYVSQVEVKNAGTGNAKNVMVRCNLIDRNSGETADTDSHFFEVIDEGDYKLFTAKLNGECGKEYNLDIDISEDYK
ncbi:hypothetical protein J2128_000101 [Methanomicrobium sp. W14]|uniref:hypothetical protein n=1 Tax=Methanomicrobium sp. W14 TaxID=2817839 RepID=UPI001AE73E7B|nr:hypothetical protein [Methanomicrobium sp. W14]MBP2132180.1 hypothetical protein [Methanomicrobium sp. W14]